jgi:YD repeat-containing protein
MTTCGSGANLSVDYRSDGRPTLIQRPYGGDGEFVYDDLGRLVEHRERATGVGHAAWQSTFFSHDALGRLTAQTKPNGMSELWSYDALGRLLGHAIHEDGVQESVAAYTYSNGRLVSVLDSVYGTAETYTYDAAGRMDIVTYPSGERLDWIYDLRSRPTGALLVGPAAQPFFRVLAFGYDAANRETTARDGDFTLLTRSFEDGRLAAGGDHLRKRLGAGDLV